jgi:hypothetical protein
MKPRGILLAGLASLLASACVSITPDNIASFSDDEICQLSGPDWITSSGERSLLAQEIKRRRLKCVVASYQPSPSANTFAPSAYPPPVPRAPEGNACLTYINTGQRYRVDATVVQGTELNRATATFNYNAFARYVVVFWGPGEASIIEMSGLFSNELPTFGLTGTDQEGRQWRVSQATAFC